MARQVQEGAGAFNAHYPTAAVVVTTSHEGKDNAMAVAWHATLSKNPPLYAVALAPKRATHAAIVASKEFAVNFVPFEQAQLVARVGGVSGRDADKFAKFGIGKTRGSRVAAPILDCAYAAYECRLHSQPTVGDHIVSIGEVVAVHSDEEAMKDLRPVLYLGADRYATLDPASLVRIERRS